MISSSVAELDAIVAKSARDISVLSDLSWPLTVEQRFLADWRAGRKTLPTPPPVKCPPEPEALREVLKRVDPGDPLSAFVGRTAEAYLQANAMLAGAGTPAFREASLAIYGGPNHRSVVGGPTVLEEAEELLASIGKLDVPESPATLTCSEARDLFQAGVDPFFDNLPVVLDPNLGSLAAAGSKRVRLRGDIMWSPDQIAQLIEHEAMVHSATLRNGQAQPLATLGLSSPRTTAVQEGLAMLAELVTDNLDLERLQRVALRVRLVSAALDGADFCQVFEQLLESGCDEQDAFRSTMRIFRGGDVRGGVVFTKDLVYLSGLRSVHGFFLAAFRESRPELADVLFAGRMTTGDAVALAPAMAEGLLVPPKIVPRWLAKRSQLAAHLTWTAFGQFVPHTTLADLEHAP